jgi:hypothetical protein
MTITKTTIRIDNDLLKLAQHRCIDEEITFQELVVRALREYLKKPFVEGRKEVRK